MIRCLFIFVCLVLITGCASGGKSSSAKYETVTANPRRDREAAIKLNQQGTEALAKGKYEKAEKHFKDALIKDVDYGPAHNNLGRLYFDQDKNYLAAWEFEYAGKVMPQRSEPHNNLGMVMERVGKWEQAIESYEVADALCPNSPEIVGNLARVLWCQRPNDLKTRERLEQLVFIDSRPSWVSWAKEQIACGKMSAPSESGTEPGTPPVSKIPVPMLPPPTLAPPTR